jgi:porin
MVSFENASEDFITGTGGWYVLAEKGFSDQLGVFFKGGQASGKINKYSLYYSGGIWFKGLFESRPSDVFGIGVAQSQLGSAYLDAAGSDENGEQLLYDAETIYEISYSIPVNDWLTVQPDIQYIDNPGFTVMNLDLWAALVRLEAVF